MQNLDAFKALISTPKRIVITTHYKPDADALGSSLALFQYLTKKGHFVNVVTPSDYPRFIAWMNGNENVLNAENHSQKAKALKLIDEAEIIFCLDFSALARIQSLEEPVRKSKAVKVMIDHHLFPEDFAEFKMHHTETSSTCELIYQLIANQLDDKDAIDIPTAECIYSGLMTDTGSFRHPCTTPTAHITAAEILKIGVNTNKIHRRIFDSKSVDQLKFLGYMLSEKMVVLPEYRVVYFTVTDEELKRYNSQTGDTEGIVNYGLQIENIVMSVILIDRPDGIKMSFRSVEEFAVNEIAKKYFNGGGHKNASGGKQDIGLEASIEKFLSILPEYQEKLTSVFN